MQKLKELIGSFGFPIVSKVGNHGVLCARMIIQHADHDIDFQKECLEMMEKLPAEEFPREAKMYLEDRIAVNEGRLQKYGTQLTMIDGVLIPSPTNQSTPSTHSHGYDHHQNCLWV